MPKILNIMRCGKPNENSITVRPIDYVYLENQNATPKSRNLWAFRCKYTLKSFQTTTIANGLKKKVQ